MNRNTDISPQEFETIERYILKDLPQEEYEAFTARLQTDPDLQNKTESVKLLLLGIKETVLEDKMNHFHKEIPSVKKNSPVIPGKFSVIKSWMVAASAIVLLGLGALLFLNQTGSREKLFTEYYTPDPGLITAMGTTESYLFEHAMIDYKTKNYDSALKTWIELLKLDPVNDTLHYFIGSAYLAKDNPAEAIPYLKKVAEKPDSYFYRDANWYVGMALIKQEKISEAIPFIEKSHHQNMEAMLRKLKK